MNFAWFSALVIPIFTLYIMASVHVCIIYISPSAAKMSNETGIVLHQGFGFDACVTGIATTKGPEDEKKTTESSDAGMVGAQYDGGKCAARPQQRFSIAWLCADTRSQTIMWWFLFGSCCCCCCRYMLLVSFLLLGRSYSLYTKWTTYSLYSCWNKSRPTWRRTLRHSNC